MLSRYVSSRFAVLSTAVCSTAMAWVASGMLSVAQAAPPAIVENFGPFVVDYPMLDCGDYWMWHRYKLSGTVKVYFWQGEQVTQMTIRSFLNDYEAYNPANPGPLLTGHSGEAAEEHYFEQIKFDHDGRAIWDKVTFKGLHLVIPGYGPAGLRIYAGRTLYRPVDPDHSGPGDPWYVEAETGIRYDGDPGPACDYLR